jgi:Type III flagellar switch regulator (C-ring) FliN C-term
MSHVQPFRLYGDRELNTIRTSLLEIVRAWSCDWFSSAPALGLSFIEEAELAATERIAWRYLNQADDVVAVRLCAQGMKGIGSLLLDASSLISSVSSPLMTEIVKECLDDLLMRVAGLPEKSREQPFDSEVLSYGGGCLVKFENSMPSMWLLIGGEIAQTWVDAEAKVDAIRQQSIQQVTPLSDAINRGLQSIEVIAGQATLSVGELAQLSIGDVIRLDSASCESVLVQGLDRTPLFKARLCAQDQHKALLISSHSH